MAKTKDQHLVVKSNSLVRASYKLSLNEQRLILQAVASLNSQRVAIRPGFNQVEQIRITAAEFGAMWKVSTKDAYLALKDATNDLYERSINEIDGKKVSKMRWVSAVTYHDGEGFVTLSLSALVTPYLTSLRDKFTQYRIGQVANLKSTYSIRLFEWCIQFSESGWMQIPLDELTRRLEVDYSRFADIRRFVIEPAIKELQAKSNLKIRWEPVKEGRKVVAARFEFEEDAQKKLEFGEVGLSIG